MAQKALEPEPARNTNEGFSELSDQIRDHWYQMAAQIESTRRDLADIITQQMDRLTQSASPSAPAPTTEAALDTQQQIEQQTQILSELVATLGVLDTHMQQLKSEIRVAKA
jgi:hypothetical protein